MLEFKDFFHLPEVDGLVEQLVAGLPGLVVVAGLDPRPVTGVEGLADGSFLPSGRAAIFGILARRILAAYSGRAVLLTAAKETLRVPDSLRYRVRYASNLAEALSRDPSVLVIDQLDEDNAEAACRAAARGVRVVAQLDCVFVGAQVARHLLDLGVPPEVLRSLAGRSWAVAVQRLPTLCPDCRRHVEPEPAQLAELQARYPHLQINGPFYQVGEGCQGCRRGIAGDVAAFDFYRAPEAQQDGAPARPITQLGLMRERSLLSMEEYLLRLALLGQVALDEVLTFEAGQLRRTYRLLAAGERALATANAQLRGRVAELETAHRVLEQRTGSLLSLQETSQALTASTDLNDLAGRIVRQVRDLCGADRIILYLMRSDVQAEVIAVSGWDSELCGLRLDALDVFGDTAGAEGGPAAPPGPAPFNGWPPGVRPVSPDVAGSALRVGLRTSLIAQHEVVGLMIVHSTRKVRFAAAEIAMLQALANQAAVAIQRTGLIEALRAKIAELQAAQAELIQKERLERELELARQVQQSLLPRVFPVLPGFHSAARSETARRVGGDLYDIFTIDATHFGVMIADVSDKGMPAALYMALTRSLLLAEAQRELSPRTVLNSVHRLLRQVGDPEMFVTVFYGVVDTDARTLTYVRAGHEETLLLRDGQIQPLAGQGVFLGLLEVDELPLSEEQIGLLHGDRLVLYTDGVVDALSPDGQAFGLERLLALLRKHAQLAPERLCAEAFAELASFQGSAEQYDDIAILVLAVD